MREAMDTITVTGMVLSAMPVGETDRRVVLLTKEQGRISAFARGACRPKSPLLAASRPFASGEFILSPRKDSYNLQSAVIREYFDPLLQDFEGMAYGCYFMEEAGYFASENMEETALLNLLFLTLRALERHIVPRPLVRLIFEFRVFAVSGEYPQVFECSVCKKPLKEGYFSMLRRNAVCSGCMKTGEGDYLSPSVVYTLQYILTAPLNKLYSFRVADEVFETLSALLTGWKRRFLDREFKSFALVESLEKGKLP